MPSHRYFIRAFLASFVLMGWLGNSFVTPPHAQAAVTGGREHTFIRVHEGLVSVKIDEAPLVDVLREISAQSGIKIVLHGSRQVGVSAQFRSVPLDRALRRLIKENFLLLYSPDHHLVEAWISNPNHPSAIRTQLSQGPRQRLPSGERRLPDSLVLRLQDEDAEQRGEAVLRLGEFNDDRALQSMIGTLQGDADAGVRERAVWALEDIGGQEATIALAEAVSGDSDDSVRRRAVEVLAKIGGPQMLEPLTRALREDPDLFVRYEALVNLAQVGDKGVGDLLRQALEDPDELISAKAEELITMQGNSGRER